MILPFVKVIFVLIDIIELVQIDPFSPKNKEIWLAESTHSVQISGIRPMRCFLAAKGIGVSSGRQLAFKLGELSQGQ
jgi:hypothetical protein